MSEGPGQFINEVRREIMDDLSKHPKWRRQNRDIVNNVLWVLWKHGRLRENAIPVATCDAPNCKFCHATRNIRET